MSDWLIEREGVCGKLFRLDYCGVAISYSFPIVFANWFLYHYKYGYTLV